MRGLARVGLLGALLPLFLLGQYYPYPYSYPSPRRIGPNTPKPPAYKGVAGSFHGKLKELTGKEITIETEEDQIVSIHRNRKTKFLKGTETIKPTDIDLESPITVDAIEEVDLSLTAVTVNLDTPKKPLPDSKDPDAKAPDSKDPGSK
jgi:hypothetical protein